METNNETQRVIENLTNLLGNWMNEETFLNEMQDARKRAFFLRRINEGLNMVATQKAIDIKNSISTLNI
jgi:hypothetical protein